MRKGKRILWAALSLWLFVSATQAQKGGGSESDCHEWIIAFSAHPNQNSLQKLSGSADAGCWALVESSEVLLSKLNDWTRKGNQWTAQYLAEHLKNLDGGDLEDALRALGEFSERDTGRLLFFAHEGILSGQELDDALTMLPLSLSDNPVAQLQLLELRRRKVTSITRKELSQQKAQALTAIDRFIRDVKENNPGR
jgi:hypothetical protein